MRFPQSRTLRTALAMVAVAGIGLSAQGPDLSGTWKLNRSSSQIAAGTGLAGLDRGGTPNSLYVTLAANGSLTVGSDHNQGTARLYMIGGESTIPGAANSTVTVKSRWEGRVLQVEATTPTPALRETWSLSADGQTLTIAVTTDQPSAAKTTLIYAKTLTESPCTAWPTPCRN